MRGLWRWSEGKDDTGELWARVVVSPGQWIDLPKADYDAQQIDPPYWAS